MDRKPVVVERSLCAVGGLSAELAAFPKRRAELIGEQTQVGVAKPVNAAVALVPRRACVTAREDFERARAQDLRPKSGQEPVSEARWTARVIARWQRAL